MVARRRLLAAGACAALATRSGNQAAEHDRPAAAPHTPDRALPCSFGPMKNDQCDVMRRATADTCVCRATQDSNATDEDNGECCCDEQSDAGYTCMNVPRLFNDSGCHRVCCESPHKFPCGDGCCPSSMTCAFNASHDGTFKSRGCCGDSAWSEEEQLAWDCCLWGDGVDCNTNAKCCLRCPLEWRRTGISPDHLYCVWGRWDPNFTCQVPGVTNCTAPQPAPQQKAPPPWYMPLIVPAGAAIGGLLVVTGVAFKVWPRYREGQRLRILQQEMQLKQEEMERRQQEMERQLQEIPGTGLFALGIWTQTYGGLRESGVCLPDLNCTQSDVDLMNRVWDRMGFTAIPYREDHRERMEMQLDFVPLLISQGQELVPGYIGGHAHDVDDHLFLCAKKASDVAPDEEVFLTQHVVDWRQAKPGRQGGSTVLLVVDCCRIQVSLQLESYRQRIQTELGLRANRPAWNKVIIFWACASGQAANEDPIRGKSYLTLAWITAVQKIGKKGGPSEDVTLLDFLLYVKELTTELSTAECGKPQVPIIDGLDGDSDSVLYSRPFSANSRRTRPMVAGTRGPASSSSTGNPCLLTTPWQAVPVPETVCAAPEQLATPLIS